MANYHKDSRGFNGSRSNGNKGNNFNKHKETKDPEKLKKEYVRYKSIFGKESGECSITIADLNANYDRRWNGLVFDTVNFRNQTTQVKVLGQKNGRLEFKDLTDRFYDTVFFNDNQVLTKKLRKPRD